MHLRELRVAIILLTGVAWSAGCESVDSSVPAVHDPLASWLMIETQPADLMAGWRVVTPDGTEIAVRGDSLLTLSGAGEYWLLFEPVAGWNSPTPNPRHLELDRGERFTATATWTQLEGDTGTVSVLVDPRVPGPRWVLQGPDAFYAAGRSSVVLEGRAPGRYIASWSSSADPATSAKKLDVLVAGEQVEFRPDDAPMISPAGVIRIDPNPDQFNASWELVESTGGYWSGSGDARLTEMPIGSYTLYWGSVPGFTQPSPRTANLDAHSELEFAVTYTTVIFQIGTVHVHPMPDGIPAPWSLFGANGAQFTGVGDSTISTLVPQRYAIVWGDHPGYVRPAPTVGTLVAGAVLPFNAQYQPTDSSTGIVRVVMNPTGLNAAWTLAGPDGTTWNAAGDTVLTGLPWGDYWMMWADVAGFRTPLPNPTRLTLGSGATITFSPQ